MPSLPVLVRSGGVRNAEREPPAKSVGAVTEELAAGGVTVTVSANHRRCLKAQPVRWRMERPLAWLKNFPGLCSDFDGMVKTTETFAWLAGVSLSMSASAAHRACNHLSARQPASPWAAG